MNKSKLVFGVVIGFSLLILLVWTMESYNRLVRLNEVVEQAWSNVENQYQRRMDLLPNLMAFVKTRMRQETHIFDEITNARQRYGAASSLNQKVAGASALDSAISRLLVIIENYPRLQAGEQYNRLMDEWTGTENRIAVQRMRYNDAARQYNRHAKSFPAYFFVKLFGFAQEKPYYKATKGAHKAPVFKEESFD